MSRRDSAWLVESHRKGTDAAALLTQVVKAQRKCRKGIKITFLFEKNKCSLIYTLKAHGRQVFIELDSHYVTAYVFHACQRIFTQSFSFTSSIYTKQ